MNSKPHHAFVKGAFSFSSCEDNKRIGWYAPLPTRNLRLVKCGDNYPR